MKYAYLIGIVLLLALLAGCNQPDNGELPPAGELPTPYSTQANTASSSATAASATSAPAASSSSAPAQASSTPATASSTTH